MALIMQQQCKTCAQNTNYLGFTRCASHETALEFACVNPTADCEREGTTMVWLSNDEADAIIYAE